MPNPAWLATAGLSALNPLPLDPADGPVRVGSPYPGTLDSPPAQVWKRSLPGGSVSSPSHTEAGGPLLYGDYIFTGSAGEDGLLMLHRSDGRLVRMLPARGVVRSMPTIAGDQLVYGDAGGAVWCFDLQGDVPRDEPTWVHIGTAPVLATPLVSENRVFVSDVASIVVALERTSGELVWRHAQRLDPGRSAELELYGHPPAALQDGLLLVGFSDGTLAGMDADAGTVTWQRRVGEGQYPDLVAAPLVLGGDVVLGGFTAPLVSVDQATQNIRWRLDDVGSSHGAALLDDGEGRTVLHGDSNGILRALDRITGAVLWEWDSDTQSALTSPIGTSAGILVGAASGSLYLVDPTEGETLWEWLPGYHVSGFTAAPAVDGRQVVGVTNAGQIVSLVAPERPERSQRPALDRLGL